MVNIKELKTVEDYMYLIERQNDIIGELQEENRRLREEKNKTFVEFVQGVKEFIERTKK